jgi:xanthine dehydrogenase accessory factor
MQKHARPEVQHGLAPLTIGLGPDLTAGRHATVVIETSWDGLGTVITEGTTRPLEGEPREIAGHARDRYVYAPFNGVFRTKARIGHAVRKGQEVAMIGSMPLTAPLDGLLRGVTRDGAPVTARTKVIEVDPRSREAEVGGITERPGRTTRVTTRRDRLGMSHGHRGDGLHRLYGHRRAEIDAHRQREEPEAEQDSLRIESIDSDVPE